MRRGATWAPRGKWADFALPSSLWPSDRRLPVDSPLQCAYTRRKPITAMAVKRGSRRRTAGPESGRRCEPRPDAGAEWTSELQGERRKPSSLSRSSHRYQGEGHRGLAAAVPGRVRLAGAPSHHRRGVFMSA
jgi:hypothetical protein